MVFTPSAPALTVGVAFDSGSIYVGYSAFNNSPGPEGRLIRIPRAGGAAEVLLAAGPAPAQLVADDAGLYWFAIDGTNGSTLQTLVNGTAGPARSVLDTSTCNFRGLALDGSAVYYLRPSCGTAPDELVKLERQGGAKSVLATAHFGSVVAADGESVYWNNSAAAVFRVSRDGGTPVQVMVARGTMSGLAVDATSVYAMSQETVYASRLRPGGDTESRVGGHTTGRVIRAPKGGGTPVTVVSQPTGLDTLRLGATRYVWRGGGPYEFHSAPK